MERQYVIVRHLIEDGKDKPQYLGSGGGDKDGSAWFDDINAPEVLKTTEHFANYHLTHMRFNNLALVCGAKVEPV